MPRVAVIGDFSERNGTHRATNAELTASGAQFEWVPTSTIRPVAERLNDFDALWISPGSPYANMDGALEAIRFARERGVPLGCSLVGQRHPVYLTPASLAAELYGRAEIEEPYYCNYGLNPEFEPRLEAAGLRVTGRDADGAARIAELDGHPFFMITLSVFQARDQSTGLHPITRRLLSSVDHNS